jgi:hypothetical protein
MNAALAELQQIWQMIRQASESSLQLSPAGPQLPGSQPRRITASPTCVFVEARMKDNAFHHDSFLG